MRVFLSSLIILVLAGCNSDINKVAVEEVDSIETKMEEVQEIEEINYTNLVRINGDSAVRFGLIYEGESGCVTKNESEFTGIVYRTNNKGVLDCEVKYFEGCPIEVKYFKSNGEADEIWVFDENNRMTSFDADSNLIYNNQPFTGYLIKNYVFDLADEFTNSFNYEKYNKDSLDKVWDLWDFILPDYDRAYLGIIYQYKNGKENGFYKNWDNSVDAFNEGYYKNGKRHGTFKNNVHHKSDLMTPMSSESIYFEGKLISSFGGLWSNKAYSTHNNHYKSGKLAYSIVGDWQNGVDDAPEWVHFTIELFYESGEIKGTYERNIIYFDRTDEYDEFKRNNKNYSNDPLEDICIGKSWYKNGQLKVAITNQNMSDNKCWDEKGNKIDCKLIELDDFNECKSFIPKHPNL